MARVSHSAYTLALALLLAGLLATAPRAQTLDASRVVVSGTAADRLRATTTLCDQRDWASLRVALLDPAPAVRRLSVACWEPTFGDAELLAALVDDPSASMRIGLATRLGQVGPEAASPSVVRALSQLAGDADPAVRAAAVEGLPIASMDEAVARLLPHLGDRSIEVAVVAARRLDELGAAASLDAATRASFERALAFAALRDTSPELVGAVAALERRVARLETALGGRGEIERPGSGDGDAPPAAQVSCEDSTRAAIDYLRERLESLATHVPGPKTGDRFELLLAIEDDLGSASQGLYSCRASTLLDFTDDAHGGLFEDSSLVGLGEVSTAWEANFGLLRSDLPSPPQGGELWVEAIVGADLLLPRRPLRVADASAVPTLELSGRLLRHQLIKHEAISSFGGGLAARSRVPIACGRYRRCALGADGLGLRSPGTDDDFPTRLVAPHRRFRAESRFELPLANVFNTLTVDVERVRYESGRLSPAGLDTLGLSLDVDSPFQLRLEARRNLYDRTGPVEDRDESNASLERDSTLLGGLLGVRFGEASADDGLQLFVLGGMTFPLIDGSDASPALDDVAPQVTFAALLVNQDGSRTGDLVRLRIGGRRWVEASPRDFALQSVSESVIDFTFQSVDLPALASRFDARLAHQLTDYRGPLTEALPDLDVNIIEGAVAVRFVVAQSIGLEVGNTTRAIRFRNGEFTASNRFVVSLFAPFGDYALGRVEGLPW